MSWEYSEAVGVNPGIIRIDKKRFGDQKQQILDHIETRLSCFPGNTDDCYMLLEFIPREELVQLQQLMQRYTDFMKQLSKRELQVLKLAINDKSSEDIAAILHISNETVKTHRKNITAKAGASSIQELKSFFHKVSKVISIDF